MIDAGPIFLIVAVLAALAFVWWQKREKRRAIAEYREPDEWHLGSIINGVNRSRGHLVPTERGFWFDIVEPHTATRGCDGLPAKGTIRARWTFDGKAWPREEPDGEPLVCIYFQRPGDTYSSKGKYLYWRYYSRAAVHPSAGELTVSLDDHEDWLAVQFGSGPREPFEEAKADAYQVGLAFGWKRGRAHGLHGSGRFELLEFTIEGAER